MANRLLHDLGARARDLQKTAPSEEPAPHSDPEAEARAAALMAPLSPERARFILDRALAPGDVRARMLLPGPRRWRASTIVAWCASSAAAAVLLISTQIKEPAVGEPPTELGVKRHASLDYEVTILGALGVERGAEPVVAVVLPGDPIRVRLRPNGDVQPGPAHVTVQAIQGDKILDLAWEVRPEGDSGVLVMEGAADDLIRGGWGRWTLAIHVESVGARWDGSSNVWVTSEFGDR